MTERAQQFSHVLVRIIATITLAYFGMGAISDKYYPAYSHAIANSRLGMMMGTWCIAASLLLPLYVGFEGWWMRKRKVVDGALWIDAALAIACFLTFLGVVLYAFGHYAMI